MNHTIGEQAPDFTLPDQNGEKHSLSDYLGKWVVIFFYPKDDTPGCTKEACNFRDNYAELQAINAEILGISTDPVESHKLFEEKYELPFTLLADANHDVVNSYGVWRKTEYKGREYEGTFRISYLIDPEGNFAKIYEEVKAAQHGEDVLADLKELIAA
jgi:peroxiredoxin Q/BCP